MSTLDSIQDLERRMAASIIGQDDVVRNLVIGLLANGNLLMEGLPGLAKTRAVKGMAKNLEADFSRIQFTPDLLPSDITGSDVLYTEGGEPKFRFEPGPIFAAVADAMRTLREDVPPPTGEEAARGREKTQTEQDAKASKSASTDASGPGGKGTGGASQGRASTEDDDIVARQLREAAENETDPELKEKLWKEYDEYKKNQR